jgi:thymidylate kinase
MLLLEKVFEIINNSGLDYCVQNKYDQMPDQIPSDIDIMYRNASEEFLDGVMQIISEQTGLLITQKVVHDYYQYTYIFSIQAPQQEFRLQLDFYYALSFRKYTNLMPGKEMLESKRLYRGLFYIPSEYCELKYIWMRRTIKKDLSHEHINKARVLYNTNPKLFASKLKDDFGERLSAVIIEIISTGNIELFFKTLPLFKSTMKRISRENTSLSFYINLVAFTIFKVVPFRIFHTVGMSVAFIAPDGAGKSSVISYVRESCSGSFYGVETLYFRPHLLRNLGAYNVINANYEKSSNPCPHNVAKNSVFKSLVRYMFYNMDFVLGWLFKIWPLKIRKNLIVFDRYYYDYYADILRYAYNMPKNLPKAFEWLIPRPDVIILLTGDPTTISSRKKELTAEETEYQINRYRLYLKRNANCVEVNVDQPLDKVCNDVTKIILQKSAERVNRIMKVKGSKALNCNNSINSRNVEN